MKKTVNSYDQVVDVDTLRETALDFAESGFRVMRLHAIDSKGNCSCGWDDCKNPGKHPSSKNWAQMPAMSVDAIDALFEAGSIRHGMGVILDTNIVIVDIDVKNGGLASLEKLETDLGETLEHNSTFIVDSGSGGGSRHYWFSKDENVKVKKTTKEYPGIDFLSAGCFVVMPNSVHKSGNTYSFPYAKKANPAKLTEAPQDLIDIIERRHSISEASSEPGSCEIAELREALAAIPNDGTTDYDETWLPIGMALHHETSGNEHGFMLWLEWSEKGPKHDDGQMRYKWESFAKGGYGGSSFTGGTIFHMAHEAGWSRNYELSVDLTPFLNGILQGEVQQLEIKKEDGQVYKSNKIPDALKSAPGMVGIVCDYIMSQAPKPLYLPSLAAALSYCGTVLGRDYRTNQDNYTGTYTIIVAPTGAGKEKPRSMIKDILVNTGQSKVVSSSPTSKGAISTALIECPRIQFQIDEIGHFIESGNGRNASQNKVDVRSALMELYGLCGSTFLPEKYSRMGEYKSGFQGEGDTEKVDLTIQKPFVSVFGMTTPAKLIDSMTKMMIQDGFINRFTIVQAQEGRQKMQTIVHRPIPQSVLNWTETARNRSTGSLGAGLRDTFNIKSSENVLDFSAESLELISKFEDRIIAKQNKLEKEGLDELYSRTVEQAMRYSLIVELALRPNSDVVQQDSVKWAIEYVIYNAEQFEKLVKFELVETKHEAQYKDGYKAISQYKEKGIAHSDLMKMSPYRGLKMHERDDIIKYLVDSEQIIIDHAQTGGKPKKTYYSTEFVSVIEKEIKA
tara:strand:+ start:18527 stop:20896 length:2370 start_codon:yes stop_codon:yes gene_type:complete